MPELLDLPSRTLPQQNHRASLEIIEALRAWVDVDIVWDVDYGAWLVLERCANPKRAATVNGVYLLGWRRSALYRDPDTKEPYTLDMRIVDWLRYRTVDHHGSQADAYRATFTRSDEERDAWLEQGWANAQAKGLDRAITCITKAGSARRHRTFGGFRKG